MPAMDAQSPSPSGLLPRNILPSISVDYVGKACGKAVSEDFFDASCPGAEALAERGIVFALADGLSGGGGRRAAETCVGGVLSDFYAAPIGWPVAQCLDRVIGALNGWLAAHNQRSEPAQSMLSTLTVLVLRGSEVHVAHVGDCRLYRARAGVIECLTTDHLWPRRDMRHVLRRAVGLDRHLVVDFLVDELLPGDRFALLSDGVWEVLGEAVIRQSLGGPGGCAALADELVARSLATQRAYYGRNDATAAIIDVLALPV
jgi:serine/threonine protein phosphatase PrpC